MEEVTSTQPQQSEQGVISVVLRIALVHLNPLPVLLVHQMKLSSRKLHLTISTCFLDLTFSTTLLSRQISTLHSLFGVTPDEIAAFMGINIAMGIVNLPSVCEYWSTNPVLHHPWFGQVRPRNRFYLINRYLHFNDNNDQVDREHSLYDKLFKIRLIIERVQESFPLHYTSSRDVSIDEQMIGTKARISFLQYVPKKPKKWGVKLWVLADSQNGYVPAFDVYTGASDTVEHGLAYSVVMNLIDPYLHFGYRLYVDNYYTSPRLFVDLCKKKTFACGTVRTNRRGLPSDVGCHLDRGNAVFNKCSNSSLTCVHWMDKRDVLFINIPW